uniref:Uncharacterized protein n=1 Tax=Arundo donax TaxID=35708 RepID=A0A0A9B0D1_ARUDO
MADVILVGSATLELLA